MVIVRVAVASVVFVQKMVWFINLVRIIFSLEDRVTKTVLIVMKVRLTVIVLILIQVIDIVFLPVSILYKYLEFFQFPEIFQLCFNFYLLLDFCLLLEFCYRKIEIKL